MSSACDNLLFSIKKGRNFMPELPVYAGLWLIKIIKFIQGKGPFLFFRCGVSSEFFCGKCMLVILFNTFTGKKSMAIPQTVIYKGFIYRFLPKSIYLVNIDRQLSVFFRDSVNVKGECKLKCCFKT